MKKQRQKSSLEAAAASFRQAADQLTAASRQLKAAAERQKEISRAWARAAQRISDAVRTLKRNAAKHTAAKEGVIMGTAPASEGAAGSPSADEQRFTYIDYLELRRPIFKQTAAYGHFGREEADFTWEKTDRADELRRAAGL